jgi:hypothetical protein
MKLRIRDNSVRIRIARNELVRLASGQMVEQRTEFSTSAILVTVVEPTDHTDRFTATFEAGRIKLQVPIDQIRELAETERVGIESHQPITENRSLQILLEKDFDCLHPKADENIDTFPNPARP